MKCNSNHTPDYYFNNLYATGLFLFLLYLLFGVLYGQKTLDNHIAENLKTIWEQPKMSSAQKWEKHFGFDYLYLSRIKQETPADAVIWMPPDSSIAPKAGPTPFNKGRIGMKTEAWALYFLYPRTLVYDTAKVNQIDYVAIVNGRGYDRLPYTVDNKPEQTLLPMQPNPDSE